MKIIAILTFIAYCTGAHPPKLWGSRIVSKASGPSDTMRYRFNGDLHVAIKQGLKLSALSTKNGKCFLEKTKLWGSPCGMAAGQAVITVADVTAQNVLVTFEDSSDSVKFTSTTFFVPRCIFPQPDPDEVSPETSFPLSRFVGGTKSFTVDFAVRGANSNSFIVFCIDDKPLCTWYGTKLVDLVKDLKSDLRIFRGVFPTKTDVSHENFAFYAYTTVVIVSIDYEQSGISPEVAECKRMSPKGRRRKVTLSTK
ncbi:hypothetical protein TcWFU_005205 [Taenia crassiceps]|uniref:DUF5727 domain-containing protein n=1 Tax=Taenia crassiceps TaxID=6207 RepID=A0ABR4Q7Y1_9CEST